MTRAYFYNVHDFLRLRSERRLPELGYFLSEPFGAPDIDVMIRSNPHAHRLPGSVLYDEIAGRYGFSLVINRAEDRTEVFASPLIGGSPHVLYTNVVEPLIRWALVRKGYALMHGACLAFGTRALFITARTDTGKTTTVLQTLHRDPDACRFLSDDMTIFRRDGTVFSYPKPLTISQHTLHAVGGAPLSASEKGFLQLQSRLHSREGRQAGMWLSHNKMPAATLSAIVQWLIPPPKFMVDRLVPGTRYADSAQLTQLVLIERGPTLERPLSEAQKVDILTENAEDAYGFPPYPKLAAALSAWNGVNLHGAEREIVAAAVCRVAAVQLRSPNYGWYERLPGLADEGASVQPAPTFAAAGVPSS